MSWQNELGEADKKWDQGLKVLVFIVLNKEPHWQLVSGSTGSASMTHGMTPKAIRQRSPCLALILLLNPTRKQFVETTSGITAFPLSP